MVKLLIDKIGYIKLRSLFKLFNDWIKKQDISLEEIKEIVRIESDIKAKKYLKAIEWLSKHVKINKEISFEEFKESLLKYLDKEYNISKIIKKMADQKLTANYYNFFKIANEMKLKVDKKLSKILFSLAKQLELLSTLNITEFTPSLRDRILVYIKNRGETRVSSIENNFPGSEKTILELWRNGIIEIDILEDLRDDISGLTDLSKVPVNIIERKHDIFSIWEDPISGEKYGTLILPPNALVRIRE